MRAAQHGLAIALVACVAAALTGNGACEILNTTDLDVVASGDHLAMDAGRYT